LAIVIVFLAPLIMGALLNAQNHVILAHFKKSR